MIKAAILSALVVVVMVSLLILFPGSILSPVGEYLVIEDDLTPADVIHVIAGEDYRTDYAIQLYQQGYANQIFFTGGWCNIHQYYHGQHGMERALAQGVPVQAIAYDDTPVMSTYDEALRLKAHLDESQSSVRSMVVVSDPYHMRRARWTYRRVLGEGIDVQMAPVPFGLSPYQKRWWEDSKSKIFVTEEYKKFMYYIARYQMNLGPLNGWLATLDKE